MNTELQKKIGEELYHALCNRKMLKPLTDRYPGISITDAYAIQQHILAMRLANGERVIGKKIGVTSQVVMDMLGVFQPDFGWLTDAMLLNQSQNISIDTLIQPKAEGEIAFLINKPIKGPGITSEAVLAATEGVIACFEIVDSRIQDWKIRIEDTIADNASCGVFVLGEKLVSPYAVDLRTCGMVLEKNGEIVATGTGAAALGHPANAVAWLANTLGQYDISLDAGDIILSGSLAAMVPVQSGDSLNVTIDGIGSCSVRFV